MKNKNLVVMGGEISIQKVNNDDYLRITDIARYKNEKEPNQVIRNRLRNRNTIEFLGLREKLNSDSFKPVEFDRIRNDAGLNAFTMSSSQRIERTSAIGIISKAGRYGGTYAHKDIAMEFASWVSVEVKLYIIKDYQRLKIQEEESLEWNVKRLITKTNYTIHTDAIKQNLIPRSLTPQQVGYIYANEADMLNIALFGKTAKQWKNEGNSSGNMRDIATIQQLIVLANMESMNAELIRQGFDQSKRISLLNQLAIQQMKSLLESHSNLSL